MIKVKNNNKRKRMSITIRTATEADFSAILGLIKELATFEKAPDSVTNSVAQMQAEKDYFHALVAENDSGEIVGTAVYFFAYSTWVGKSLYLDDLYVKADCRGEKIGTRLLAQLFEIAKIEQCKRVRWQVLDWNTPAIELYEKMGASIESEWNNCDFDVEQIQRMQFNH